MAFSSEIQALLELPGIDTEPDRQAIHDFTALSYIPAPETFYIGIRALEPGEILAVILDDGEPIRNVPQSVSNEGHAVLGQEDLSGSHRLIIRKRLAP